MAVDCRRNIDHALPIAAVDFAETATLNQGRRPVQRDLATIRSPDAHGFQIPEPPPALFRVANQDLDFITTTL